MGCFGPAHVGPLSLTVVFFSPSSLDISFYLGLRSVLQAAGVLDPKRINEYAFYSLLPQILVYWWAFRRVSRFVDTNTMAVLVRLPDGL